MDGVLIDSERLIREAWIHVGRSLQLDGIKNFFTDCIGISYESTRHKFAARYGSGISYDDFRSKTGECYRTMTENGIPVKKGARALLQCLKEQHWRIGLASSTRTINVLHSLKQTNLLKYFDAVICGDMVQASKPEPDIYLAAAKALNVMPDICLAVEDSKNGLKSASSAGMRVLLVPDLIAPDSEMLSLAHAVFADLTAVQRWLLNTANQI